MNHGIRSTWSKNAQRWSAVIDGNEIESRRFTNAAILRVIQALGPQRVADLGCGEGWLCRALQQTGIEAYGFDGTIELVALAQQKSQGRFEHLAFEDIISGLPIPYHPYDLIVFNFALYLKDEVAALLIQVMANVRDGGAVVIQTVHPDFLIDRGLPYRSQWIADAWEGLPGGFEDGHAWYARTLEDWKTLISEIPNSVSSVEEVHDSDGKPLSLIFILNKLQ
ncbi:MAG: methyltransferase domain-containing protein [Flavobacteriaceae bacterium]|nr:methyltransferase domain-containing protein [Flavobacteriaceae bacterium]